MIGMPSVGSSNYSFKKRACKPFPYIGSNITRKGGKIKQCGHDIFFATLLHKPKTILIFAALMQKQNYSQTSNLMKIINCLAASLVFGAFLLSSGCEKEKNEVTINIVKPVDNQTVANKSAVEIQVDFVASEENEEVEVHIYMHGDSSNPVFEWHEHEHDPLITLTETIDLSSFPPGTKFHLEAEACLDHKCKEKVSKEIEFSIP